MGFGIKKEAGSNTTPSEIVNFDKLTPTTVGVVFTPNTPATEDVLYLSSVDASTWIWNGTAYVTYSPPATSTTEWYLLGTTIDAGSNKTAPISRNNSIYTQNYDSYFNGVRIGMGNNNIATNTIVGSGAGGAISTGSNNSFFGKNSGISTTTGSYNVASGFNSFFTNTTGNYNVVSGFNSLQNNTTGSYNIASGVNSLFTNTTGSDNIASGANSFLNNTTGSDNVVIGHQSGRWIADGATSLTIANTSVFLGSETKALADNQTNQIVIGHGAIGKGSNTVNIGNTSITNTYLNGAVTFNNAFTFPTTDGTANYFLKTNGSGTVTWGVAGLSFFSEAQSTTAPNATVYANSLTAVSTTTNADFVIRPKGTGAILGNIPDNTATGGNKRGQYAVDLQTLRTAAARVASGNYSVISGGHENSATNIYSSVLGGYLNTASGQYSSQLGGYATGVTGDYAGGGGYQNQIGGVGSFGWGGTNTTSANYCTAFGNGHTLSQQQCFAGGNGHTLSNFYSAAFGSGNVGSGYANFMTGVSSKSFDVHMRQSVGGYGYVVAGDNQSSTLILSGRTTSATPKVLCSADPVFPTPSASTQLTLQNNNAMRVKGSIIAKQTGTTNVGAWDIDFVIVRGANAATTTIVGTPTVSTIVNPSSWGIPTITANTTIGCPTITVTGVALTNIQWGCSIASMEVIY